MSLNTDYGNEKEREGILEELFIHEGSHASLDGYHANVSIIIVFDKLVFTHLVFYNPYNSINQPINVHNHFGIAGT